MSRIYNRDRKIGRAVTSRRRAEEARRGRAGKNTGKSPGSDEQLPVVPAPSDHPPPPPAAVGSWLAVE